MVAFGFFPQNFGEVVGTYEWYFAILWMRFQWQRYHEAAGALKPYLMQKNLFEFFALTGSRDAKSLDESSLAIACAEPPGETLTTFNEVGTRTHLCTNCR